MGQTDHHRATVRCSSSGEQYDILIPGKHKHHWLAWGDAERVHWKCPKRGKRCGIERARGKKGITVVDEDGEVVRLKHGEYHVTPGGGVVQDVLPMGKAKQPQKAGSRWITVHPHGDDEKGVPVLIEPAGDGKSWRVIGGAGGKLNHLKLDRVKEDTEENREEWQQKSKERKEKRDAKREEVAKRDEGKPERASAKQDLEHAKVLQRIEERKLIEKVRDTVGGVDEDLPKEDLDKLSPEARRFAETLHHKRQMKQVRERLEAVREQVSSDELVEADARAAVRKASMEADPAVSKDAQELAQQALALDEQERKERRSDRARKASRHTKVKSGELAAEEILDDIRALDEDKLAEEIEELGGRRGPGEAGASDSAVDDLKREVLQHREDAALLTKLADDKELTEAELGKLTDAAKREGWAVDPEDLDDLARGELKLDDEQERLQQAIRNEAARKYRKAELREQSMAKLEDIEGEKGKDAAHAALAFSRMQTRIAAEVRSAREAGLEAGQPGIQQAEIAEVVNLLSDAESLREARAKVRKIQKALDAGDYGKARDAFTLTKSDEAITDAVKQSILDDVRTQLTQQLTGLMDPDAPEHMRAASAGQFDSLGDVALGIGKQRYLDREVVDGVGLTNAAVLQRYAMEQAGVDSEAALKALESHHVERMEQITTDAIAAAEAVAPDLVDAVRDVGDIETALQQVQTADADLVEAQRAIGAALGRMEATAALGQAFRDDVPESIVLPHGGDKEGTLRWAQAMGLKPGMYSWDDDEKGLRVPQSAWGALIRPHDPDVKIREAVDAIKAGDMDEDGWLPAGIVERSSTTFTDEDVKGPYRVFKDLALTRDGEPLGGEDLTGAVRDHVMSRLVEGADPWEVRKELTSATTLRDAPDPDGYLEALREVMPLTQADEDGSVRQMTPQDIERWATNATEDWMTESYGHSGDVGLYRQKIDLSDDQHREAAFRALTQVPHATIAFQEPEDLSGDDRRQLRDYFNRKFGGKNNADYEEYTAKLMELGPEPQKERPAAMLGLFGEAHADPVNPDWRAWNERVQSLKQEYPRFEDGGKSDWAAYVEVHGDVNTAYESVLADMRGDFYQEFSGQFGKITKGKLITTSRDIPNADAHLKGVASGKELAEFRERRARLNALVQNRGSMGRFAEDAEIVEKRLGEEAASRLAERQQVGMFGGGVPAEDARAAMPEYQDAKPGQGQAMYMGPAIEKQMKLMVKRLDGDGRPFGRDKTDLFPGLSMSGGRVDQQRTIKTLFANGGRLGGWLGTGSGKSLISIGACTEAIERGETKKGLFLAPTSVVEQFGGEMLRFTEPGKYRWATGTGMNHEQRVEAMKSDDHFLVLTHQAFRDTSLRVMADHHRGGDVKQMQADLEGIDRDTRARWMREAFDAAGIPKSFIYYDEAHMGGVDSGMGLVKSMATHPENSTHMLMGTATPHKNDESEMAEMAALIRPDRYGDKEAFLRNFGENARHNADSVRREMAPYTFSAKIDPSGVDKINSSNPRMVDGRKVMSDEPLALHPEQSKRTAAIREAYDKARAARKAGRVDLDALRTLHPERFEGLDEAKAQAVGERMNTALGMARDQALRRAINQSPPGQNAKLDALLEVVTHDATKGQWRHKSGEMKTGKPSIIFTDSKREATMIHEALAGKGMRSGLFHGGVNTRGREKIRKGMKAGELDVIVATSAMEAGVNVQAAKVVHHYDVPMTEKSHAQRSGRAYRQGQKGDVEIHDWHTADPYEEQARRRLRRKRGLASVFETPIRNMDETGVAAAYQRELAEKHAAHPGLAA